MPPVPDPTPLETDTDQTHYDRLKNSPDSQPAIYRRLIRNEGRIKRPKFEQMCRRHTYEPEGGSHGASLLILDRLGEIERQGQGDNQILIWTGD